MIMTKVLSSATGILSFPGEACRVVRELEMSLSEMTSSASTVNQ